MFTLIGADGKEYGPVTAANVIEWIRDGRANLQTKAKLSREDVWKTLGDFPEFGGRSAPVAALPAVVREDASRWVRLPAAMIDGLLKALAYLPISVPLVRAVMAEALSGQQRGFAEISELTNTIVFENLPRALPFLSLLVLVQLVLLAWRGQSIGKLLLRLRIVRIGDGAAPGAFRAFLLRGTVPFLIEQVPVGGFVFWLVDSCYIFRNDHRCLHDLIAGTRVVPA